MSAPELDLLSEEPCQWIRLFLNPDTPVPTRQRAVTGLQVVIRRVARRLAAQAGHYGQDLVEESLSLILHPDKLVQFDLEGTAPFEHWVYRVLRNYLIDRYRQEHRYRHHWETLTTTLRDWQQEATLHDFDFAHDLEMPFSAADQERLATWPAMDRLVLLFSVDLWRKMPTAMRLATLRECGLEGDLPLTDQDVSLLEPAERLHLLAPLLGCKFNTLVQRWHRGRRRLQELDFVNDLGGA